MLFRYLLWSALLKGLIKGLRKRRLIIDLANAERVNAIIKDLWTEPIMAQLNSSPLLFDKMSCNTENEDEWTETHDGSHVKA